MRRVAAQRLHRVAQDGGDHGEELLDRLRRAGEVDDQRRLGDAGDPAREDAQRRVLRPLRPQRLRDPGRLAVDHHARRLRRDVVGRHPGPARGEHEVGVVVHEVVQPVLDQPEVVRHDLHGDHVAAGRLGERGELGP
jgi:hypothetical protein